MNNVYTKFFGFLITLLLLNNVAFSQVIYNDGPLRLRVWVHKVWSSANCGEIGNKEYVMKDVRARVSNTSGGYTTSPSGFNITFSGSNNRYWDRTQYSGVQLPGGVVNEANGYRVLDVTFSGSQAPTEFQVYLGESWEDDCNGDVLSCGGGSSWTYEGCCCLFGVCALGDDYRYSGVGWSTVNFRSGTEGQVNYSQPVLFKPGGGEHAYSVVYAYQWEWTGNEKATCSSPKYKDGNITVTASLVGVFSDMDWDGGTCGLAVGGNEDLRIKILAKDNLTASFPSFPTGGGSAIKISQSNPAWNSTNVSVFNTTYTTASTNMESLDFAWDVWEEDGFYLSILGLGISCGTDDNYEGSDYAFPWFCINSDDAHHVTRIGAPGTAVVTGYSINWRESPPNTDNYVDIPVRYGTSSYQNWFLRFRYRWTISAPTVSVVTTDLQGCLATPISYPAANVTSTNATYYQWQVADILSNAAGTCPSGAVWTNVPGAVCPNINFPQVAGTRVYRLVVYNRNGSGSTTSSGPKFDSAVSNCIRVTYFPYAPPIISAACGKSVPSGGAINFTVPSPPDPTAIANGLAGWTYSWSISPATNVSPTTATGATFSPTFTAAAAGTTYTVTLTVTRSTCSPTTATSTCTFTVTTPSCDMLYVSNSVGNDGNPGTATQPYRTIGQALANISGARVHVKIEGGQTYANETRWTIPANTIIDGGWEIVNLAAGEWRKNSSLTTTVNMNPGAENNASTAGFHRGIVSGGNGWLMQDLTVNVKTVTPATGQYAFRGYSVYGIYINGNTGWEIKRTTVTAGPGSIGAAGTTPAGSGGAGGGAASGGGGGNGSTADCGCNWQSAAATGGAGAANNGTGGSGGAAGSNCCGSGCNGVGCDASGCVAGNGGTGGAGQPPTAGSSNNWSPGTRPGTPAAATPYFIPAGQAASGGSGGGGGRGGGGGGGDHGTCCLCSPCPSGRANGGTGGNGGGGGVGGTGGWGGGGSFGVYIVGASSGNLSQSTFNAGTPGAGGNGAAGQAGGAGSGGSAGINTGGCGSPTSRGLGGTGGTGGAGGQGGRGQDGANGLASSIVNLATTPGLIVTSGGTPAGPNAAADYLKATYNKGCTNSIIEIEKAAGSAPPSPAFDLTAMGATIINDESPNTSSYTNTTGALTLPVEFANALWRMEKLSGVNGWTTFIRITETRPLPTITTSPKRICSGESVDFTITSNNPNQDFAGNATDYEWRTRIYKDGAVRRSPVPAWSATSTGSGPNTISSFTNTTGDTITYLIAARVKDKCCGWSKWIYDSVVVFPALNPATAWTSVPAGGTDVCISGAPATLSVNIPTGQSGGITGGAQAAYFIYRYSTDGGITWTAWSITRPTAITKVIGTTIVQSAYVSPTSTINCDTAFTTVDITWTINEDVNPIAALDNLATCGTPNLSAEISAATPAVGTGQWTKISGASSSTPATPTSTESLTITGIPYGTTNNVYRWTVTNGACTGFTDVTISSPSLASPMEITTQSDACYTCPIANGQTYDFYDFSGKIIMRIEDISSPASALANTEVCTHIHPYTPQTWTVAYADSQPYLLRYWTITPELNTTARITLYFTAAEYNALRTKASGGPYAFNSPSDLRVSKFPGGGGTIFAPPHIPGGENVVTGGFGGSHPAWVGPSYSSFLGAEYQVTFTVDEFSTFYIHPVRFPYEVLPVELVSFSGTNVGDRNKLEWVTVSEQNTNRFVVEKSVDALNWFYLGEQAAAGNSNSELRYNLFDNYPLVGNNYYRLKIIDYDDTYEYSQIINIPLGASNTSGIVGAYPNPTVNEVNVIIASADDLKTSLNVYDVLGKVVMKKDINLLKGVNTILLNLNDLANAAYIVVFTDNSGTEHKYKIVKQ
jgi:hypothetical protein